MRKWFIVVLAVVAVLIVKTIDFIYVYLIGGLFCLFILGWCIFKLTELNLSCDHHTQEEQ